MWRSKRLCTLAFAVQAAVALAGGACSDFQDLKIEPHADYPPAPSGCNLVHPPLPYSLSSPPPGSIDFTVAVENYDLGDTTEGGRPVYETIGYDLDGLCTTADAGYGCREPSWATALHADGPGGRDNSVGASIFNVNAALGMSAGATTSLASSGKVTGGLELAIRVSGYNGMSVSRPVTVTYYGVALHGSSDAGMSYPRWDGTDAYDVVDLWLEPAEAGASASLDQALYQDTNAYVTTGPPGPDGPSTAFLVSRVDPLLVGGGPFHLRHALMTAEIAWSGSAWVLRNGTLAGRVPIDEVLHSVANAPDLTTNVPYCRGSPQYLLAKGTACANADISYSGPDDLTQPCDAASWAWRFTNTAHISLVGVSVAPTVAPSPCPPGTSPSDDHCGS